MEACRRCGATLGAQISWCGNCLTSQRRRLSRRAELHGPGHDPLLDRPPARVVHSRTRSGPTTWSLGARIVATVVIVVVFVYGLFTPFVLGYLLGFAILPGLLLRSIWRKEAFFVEETDVVTAGTETVHDPRAIRPLWVIAGVGCAVLLGGGVMWALLGSIPPAGWLFLVGSAGVAAVVAWLSHPS